MSRKILFRAKCIYDDKLIEGSLIQNYDGGGIYIERPNYARMPVDKDTVCQFTGHYAENHTPIFEGDVVECIYFNEQGDDTQVRGIVTWQDWGYVLKPIGEYAQKYKKLGYEYIDMPYTDDTESHIKVIRSSYDD